MLIHADRSLLLLIDLQERLVPTIPGMPDILQHNLWLTEVAQRMNVPVAATVQYPQKLGGLVSAFAQKLEAKQVVDKLHFSALADGCLHRLPTWPRPQIILTGIEAHVCVLQTALDLRALGKEVFVVAEAIGSRDPANRHLAIERLRQEGCRIVSREMVAFEWLHRAGTEVFRSVHKDFLR